ncbi:MAG: ankyrin repeat domain-containing protein [Alphaproteobacteria bacterium]|nr:ankyrin repeat domain-containing protein [Alphaproteobacteria bacterium]
MRIFIIALVGVALLCPVSAAALESDIFPELVYITAVREGDMERVESFLERGFDVNAVDGDGLTPLFYAAKNGDVDMAEILLKYRASIKFKDRFGNTALVWACERGHTGVAEILIEAGSDIDVQNRNGFTPLMRAIEAGETRMVEFLIEKGSDLTLQDYTGRDIQILADIGRSRHIQKIIREALQNN